MVFLAVLFALFGLAEPGLLAVRPLLRVAVPWIRLIRLGAPLLTQLCVLRT
jgi:hypothetical protein